MSPGSLKCPNCGTLIEITLYQSERERGPPARNNNESWRGDPISDKQRAFMSREGLAFNEGMTKGQASDLIDGYFRNKKRG